MPEAPSFGGPRRSPANNVPQAGRARRVTSPADILRLIVAAVALVVTILLAWVFGDAVVVFASELFVGIDAIPDWLLTAAVVGIRLLAVAVLVGGLLVTAVRARWAASIAMALGGATAALLVALLDDLLGFDEGAVVATPRTDLGLLTSGWFPTTVGLGALAGALTAGAPWLSRGWRHAGWMAVIGLMVVRTGTSTMSWASAQAVLVGWFAGAGALVAVGGPLRRADVGSITGALAAVGLSVDEITAAGVDARGSTPYFATTRDGGRLFLKVLGRDERSADLMFRIYRKLQGRDFGDGRPFSSLRRAVEHEAFLALAVHDLGIRTPRVRTLAVAGARLDGARLRRRCRQVARPARPRRPHR